MTSVYCLVGGMYRRLRSMKNSGLNFRKFSVTNGTTFSQNFRKRGQPREVYPSFQKFLTGNYRSIWFSSRNFQNFWLNGSLFDNSTISRFSRNFAENFPTIVTVSKFLVEWKAPGWEKGSNLSQWVFFLLCGVEWVENKTEEHQQPDRFSFLGVGWGDGKNWVGWNSERAYGWAASKRYFLLWSGMGAGK